jgi:hypothetical protein
MNAKTSYTTKELEEITGLSQCEILYEMKAKGFVIVLEGHEYTYRVTPVGSSFVIINDGDLEWHTSIIQALNTK